MAAKKAAPAAVAIGGSFPPKRPPAAAVPPLTQPFSWQDAAFQPLLDRLQGNILKGHGRDHTVHLFYQVRTGQTDEARAALKSVATLYVTSALHQLKETQNFREAKAAGKKFVSRPFVSMFLTAAGYAALGIPAAETPADRAFRAGMRASGTKLADPAPSAWDAGLQASAHVMILVAEASAAAAKSIASKISDVLKGGLTLVHRQVGKAIRNEVGEGIEHFGYVDGRSQPLFLLEDITHERDAGGTSRWDAAFPPDRVLVKDVGAPADTHAFGSYFIFRKLEERVRSFKTEEQKLATHLNLTGDERELAGALVVGRFEDGTPVTLSKEPLGPAAGAVSNDFDYEADALGGKCPFHAHIRKTNPRESAVPTERLTIMARRGITYEDVPRKVAPKDLPEATTFKEFLTKVAPKLPEGDVGLLFMAYNVDIAQQFEITQALWANNAAFPPHALASGVGQPGIDPVIGQSGGAPTPQTWPTQWKSGASPQSTPFLMAGHVVMKGGDYFFAPSLTFLRGL